MLLKKAFGVEKACVPPKILHQVSMLIGMKAETFSFYLERLRFLTGNPNLGEKLETQFKGVKNPNQLDDNPAFVALLDPYTLQKTKRCFQSISPILANEELFVLILLESLLNYQQDLKDWHRAVIRSLMKKIKDLCAINGNKDPQCIYGDFHNDVKIVIMSTQRLKLESENK